MKTQLVWQLIAIFTDGHEVQLREFTKRSEWNRVTNGYRKVDLYPGRPYQLVTRELRRVVNGN